MELVAKVPCGDAFIKRWKSCRRAALQIGRCGHSRRGGRSLPGFHAGSPIKDASNPATGNESMDHTTTYNTLYLIFGFFIILLSILWILIPFAVFGIKGLLRDLLREVRRNNELQDQIVTETRLVGRTRVVDVRDPV
jgi:hypothetical protein